MRQGSPYAIRALRRKRQIRPRFLRDSALCFEQSGTRIKDHLALDSAARHIAQSKRLRIELDNDQHSLPGPDRLREMS